MRLRWDETTVWQWGLLAMIVGFIAGATTGLVAVGVLLVRVLIPQRHWWAIADGIELGLFAVIFGGAGTGVASAWAVSWVGYRTGVHRCAICGRPRRRRTGLCSCQPVVESEQAPTLRERVGRWLRANGPLAATLAAALVPIAAAMVAWAAHRRPIRSWVGEAAACHALCCCLVLVRIESAELLPSERVRGWHARWKPPAALLAVYDFIYIGAMVVRWG